jgi:hypothetical protein
MFIKSQTGAHCKTHRRKTMKKHKHKWKPFYFDGNEAWGTIDSPEEWSRIKRAYKTDLGKARRCGFAKEEGRDIFGFRAECNGKETLKEFFESNGMEI